MAVFQEGKADLHLAQGTRGIVLNRPPHSPDLNPTGRLGCGMCWRLYGLVPIISRDSRPCIWLPEGGPRVCLEGFLTGTDRNISWLGGITMVSQGGIKFSGKQHEGEGDIRPD